MNTEKNLFHDMYVENGKMKFDAISTDDKDAIVKGKYSVTDVLDDLRTWFINKDLCEDEYDDFLTAFLEAREN